MKDIATIDIWNAFEVHGSNNILFNDIIILLNMSMRDT